MAAHRDEHLPPPLTLIYPPLLNSANPWATTLEDLKGLFGCPHTGAVTTRTALLDEGFAHDDLVHQYAFFDVGTHVSGGFGSGGGGGDGDGGGDAGVKEKDSVHAKRNENANASLNTLGYSPIPLDSYLDFIGTISDALTSESDPDSAMEQKNKKMNKKKGEKEGEKKRKPFIISVTGDPAEVAECYRRIARRQRAVRVPLAMEVNLSCPNIPGKPPPAYEGVALGLYLRAVCEAVGGRGDGGGEGDGGGGGREKAVRIPWGLKTPPYTHAGQFERLASALREAGSYYSGSRSTSGDSDGAGAPCPVSFITATNTLGSCLLLADPSPDPHQQPSPKLPGALGIGGMAGAPLHPLALGNVATLRRLLDADVRTRHVALIGVGGVEDAAGYRRMRAVGAVAVGDDATPLHRCRTFDEAVAQGHLASILATQPSYEERGVAGTLRSGYHACRAKTQRFFRSKTKHWLILTMIILDIADILTDVFIALITCELRREDEPWVAPTRAALAYFASTLGRLFVVELILSVFADGLEFFYNWSHCFDALVIVLGFAVDLLEHNVTGEIVSLIVILRLWRFFKIVQDFWGEQAEQTEELRKRVEDLEKRNADLEAQLMI
ncbi:Uu.00g104060.m01.CDS01 [Anthostomella pinea]|uniref:Uu.00g104060.m01.CDS01 n=1 Tax=Anthostomella pinea TaxID=933095 RepID=A0AAI8YFN3_9PEZI|nr:Uu.00g104060.m01.CDS01 [Anthostomella pinea]